MNVSCPECRSVFRVDPSKLPPTTVRARCSVCGGVITIAEGGGASIEEEFASSAVATPSTARASRAAAQPTSSVQPIESWRRQSAMEGASLGGAAASVAVGVETPSRAAVEASSASPPQAPRMTAPTTAPAPAATGQAIPAATVSQTAPPATRPQQAPGAPAAPSAKPPQNRPLLFPPRPMMPGGAPGSGNGPARPVAVPLRPPAQTPPSAPQVAPRSLSQPQAPSTPAPIAPNAVPAAAASPPEPTRPAASGTPAGSTTGARAPINPFLANDPHAKAKRLARALVSDLVTYFPQKCEEGLRDGTLKQLFKDEIQKSHEEYVAQVGREFAETTPHFQDALNDILARGQKVF